jgi:hypothetical protein
MIYEILYTVEFISSFIEKSKLNIPITKIIAFKNALTKTLIKNYANHWNESNPLKYRNLRSIKFDHNIDYNVLNAWHNNHVNLPTKIAKLIFPIDIVIYCDPHQVTFQYKRYIYTLYKTLT